MQQFASLKRRAVMGWLATFCSLGLASQSFGKPFVIGTLQDPAQIYPLMQKSGDNKSIRHLINPPVLTVRNDGRIICILCKELPELSSRKSEDGAATTFVVELELKKKLKWADGAPLTPQDIKYTLETMARADYGKGKDPLLPIRRIEMDEDNKNIIRLVLTHRRADAFQLFAISLLPSHKADLIQKLQKETRDANWWNRLQDPGLYYGAYLVKSATPERWQLASNPEGEWEDAPTQDLELRLVNGIPALAKALQSGEVDQTAEGELSWLDWLALKEQVPGLEQKFSLQSRPGHTLELILLNLRSPLLVNPQLRQILQRTIQRQTLVKNQLQGHGLPAATFLHPTQLERINEKVADPYQPQRVAQLLDQIGGRKAADGTLTIDGQKIHLILTCSDERMKSGFYQPVLEDLRKIGAEVKLEIVPEEEFVRQTLPQRRFKDMACMRWNLPPLSPPINLMHSLAIPNSENNYYGSNFSGWDMNVVDRILESMQRDAEPIQLQRLLSRLDKQFMSELPAFPLVYLPDVWLNRKEPATKDILETQERISAYPSAADLPVRKM
ncbi:MAG TPA: ABC transporter substrate-binding protein [Oligoflexus sp.]|uniref:ABC transporter substrate-binding protein n=1 Tax=Oligoflexus sp. TaxID=1971216 RepID=UPI002D5D6316|nr:ABC transporter substrate-binding protein [Oligoflexus sp.]HYX39901.1 ABC transporter substrate-binding protein [Oligoflexus sp.]